MKRFLVFAVLALVAVACVGYVSNAVVQEDADKEYTGAVAGAKIREGQVVSLGFSYREGFTGTYDTGSWVILSESENDSYVCGVAVEDADTFALVRLQVHGVCEARVDYANDSWVIVGPATNMDIGSLVSAADRDGFLGAANNNATNTADLAFDTGADMARQNVVGYMIEPITTAADSGALTTYQVFLTIR